jgi:hypothetical protein
MEPTTAIPGTLHITIAFDWGEEIDLTHAARLVPAEQHAVPRRRRTPPSIAFRKAPLLVRLAPTNLELPVIGDCTAQTDVTVFDFAAVSLTFRIPLHHTAEQLARLAPTLADTEPLVAKARQVAMPLYEQLLPAIKGPAWCKLIEEYFTFQLEPSLALPSSAELLKEQADWLAGLVRLEDITLGPDEVAEALRLRLSYTPRDLVVIEWAAAVVVDTNCEDTLLAIEFANVQLLEYRAVDDRVDEALDRVYGLIHRLAQSWLPFWRLQTQPQRALGDMRIDAVVILERTGSTLKLVGDQYLARIYRLLAARFRLDEWSQGIRQSLDEAQGVYETLAEQSATYRIELLEVIIVLLIVIEIVLAIAQH